MIEYYKNLSLKNLFYIDENGIVQEEEWRDVPSYVKKYQLSTLGRAKSLRRLVFSKNTSYYIPEIILKQSQNEQGRLQVTLTKDSVQTKFKVHQLMGIVFLEHTPCGHEVVVDHKKKGNPKDNRLSNLQIITQKENSRKDKTPISGQNCVYFDKGKYRIRFNHEGKRTNFGRFDSKEEAVEFFKKIDEMVFNREDISDYIKNQTTRVFKNITLHQGKYRVRINVNKKVIRFPSFDTLEEAKSFVLKYRQDNNLD